MRHYNKRKMTCVLILTAAVGSASLMPHGGLLTAQAAQADPGSPVTEYDEEILALFRDDVLEYWEIPGLIEQYNMTFRNQLEKFYYNPDSSRGLTKQQLLDIAADLREEAESLETTAEDDKDSLTRLEYENYKSNVRVLRARAKDLEDSARGKTAAGSAAVRELRILKDQQTKAAREMMRSYQTLEAKSKIADNALEIAGLAYDAAKRQMELGIYSAENVLDAERALNSARADAQTARTELTRQKQELIKMLGWRYDASPEIIKVPEPDAEKIAGYNPGVDEAKAIENNMTLFDTRMTASAEQGGAVAKARKIKDQENEVRTSLELLYKDVLQKQASYEAAKIKFAAEEANKAAADRKNALGMLSRQEYLTAENAWLSAEASYESAGLSLTAAMEEYEWAVKGLMELDTQGA